MAGLSGSTGETWDEGPGVRYQPEHFIPGLHHKAQEESWLKEWGGQLSTPAPRPEMEEGSGSSGRHLGAGIIGDMLWECWEVLGPQALSMPMTFQPLAESSSCSCE